MKKILNIGLAAILLGLGVSSCNLNQEPTSSFVLNKPEDGLKTALNVQNFSTGILVFLRGAVHGESWYCTEQQSDLYNATNIFGNRGGEMHRQDGQFNSKTYAVANVWNAYYAVIAQCNYLLQYADGILNEDSDTYGTDLATVKKAKGEAYFCRAYCYHQLAKLYCDDYEPGSTQEGLPLATSYDPNAKPSKSSLEQVYALINDDIAQATTLLKTARGTLGATRPTIDAVKALRARVELCLHEYDKAIATADELINGGTYPLVSTASDLKSMWAADASSESIFMAAVAMLENVPANDIYLGGVTGRYYSPDFMPTQTVLDLYAADDFRKAVYFTKGNPPVLIGSYAYSDLTVLNKFPGNPQLYQGSAQSNFQHKAKYLRIGEMYLIKAEASDASGGDAAAALNALRTARKAGALPEGDITEGIRNEWVREMIGEGVRTECLKRWNIGFTGRVPQYEDVVVNQPASAFTEFEMKAGDYRMTWPIPNAELLSNPNLFQNKRWTR